VRLKLRLLGEGANFSLSHAFAHFKVAYAEEMDVTYRSPLFHIQFAGAGLLFAEELTSD